MAFYLGNQKNYFLRRELIVVKQKDVLGMLINKKPFQASNIFATVNERGEYVVYSYQTVILTIKEDGTVSYFDEAFYSATTSKLQNKIRKAFHL